MQLNAFGKVQMCAQTFHQMPWCFTTACIYKQLYLAGKGAHRVKSVEWSPKKDIVHSGEIDKEI